jgi:hypothetical protein
VVKDLLLHLFKKGAKTDCCNYRRILLLSTAYKILYNILLPRLTPYVKEITGDRQCGFDVIDPLLTGYPVFFTYWKKSETIMGQYNSYL